MEAVFSIDQFTNDSITELRNLVRKQRGQDAINLFIEKAKEVEQKLGEEAKKTFMAEIRKHIERFV